jgi:hypothetical protein
MTAHDSIRIAHIAQTLDLVAAYAVSGRTAPGALTECALITASGIRDESIRARAEQLIALAMDWDLVVKYG